MHSYWKEFFLYDYNTAKSLVIARREKSCNGNTFLQSFEYVQQEEKLHKSSKGRDSEMFLKKISLKTEG